jgi:hypothetical protein
MEPEADEGQGERRTGRLEAGSDDLGRWLGFALLRLLEDLKTLLDDVNDNSGRLRFRPRRVERLKEGLESEEGFGLDLGVRGEDDLRERREKSAMTLRRRIQRYRRKQEISPQL